MSEKMEKTDATHAETVSDVESVRSLHFLDDFRLTKDQTKHVDTSIEAEIFVDDKARARRIVRQMDLRILPLCAFVYLLN